jgi:hypothetical protein
MPFDYLGRIQALTPGNLTIREQTRLADNPNDLRWRAIAPRVEAPSIKISEISSVDFRPTGGRREWNAQGREIPDVLGPVINAEMVPINPTKHLDERHLQLLRERAQGVQDLITRGVVKDVDAWATSLADAADRQIEQDFFEAWFKNQITVMDPKTGTTVVVSTGISSSRYVAASATLAAATNAFVDFMGYLAAARSAMGSVGAVRLRQARLNEILADAPAFSGDRMSLRGLQQRINDEGYGNVAIVVDERTYNTWTDGGSAVSTAYYVPADRIAFQPASGIVGATHFAPVTRAYDYMSPQQVRNVNDFTVFYSEKNDGKTLLVEAQANALSLPIEQFTFVVTGVA